MIIAKVVDDILVNGSIPDMTAFYNEMKNKFKLGRFLCNVPFEFPSLFVEQNENGAITVSMLHYLQQNVTLIPLFKEERGQMEDLCAPEFHGHVRKCAGALKYLGKAVLPQASFVAS